MQAHDLKPPKGARQPRKRIGRGNASGTGTYSGRGLKGQKSRAGRKPRRFFEGGQTELMRRLPRKRGFTNPFRVEFSPVNLRDLNRFDDGSEVTLEALKEAGVISTLRNPVKVLATGELKKKLKVTAHKFSMTARKKIEAAGGTATALMPDEPKAPPKERPAKSKAAAKKQAEAKSEEPAPKAAQAEDEPGAGKGEDSVDSD